MKLTEEWVARNAEEAIRAFIDDDNFGVGYVAICWARRDPKAALAFIADAPEGFQTASGRTLGHAGILNSVLIGMQQGDPELTIELMKALPDSVIRNREIMSTFSALAAKNPERALQMAEGLPGDLERLRALQAVASAIGRNDPARAAELLQRIPGERARATAEARSMSGRSDDYSKRAQQVGEITNPIARSDATRQVTGDWFLNKPAEIGEFALRDAEQSGNPIWLRAIADFVVDSAESSAARAQTFDMRQLKKLPADARAWLHREISSGPATPGTDSVLHALD